MIRNLFHSSKLIARSSLNSSKGSIARFYSGIPLFPNEETICKNLSSFPEFATGLEAEKKKNYNVSLTQYGRIYDICLSILDKSNDMTFYILYKMIALNLYMGHTAEAKKLLDNFNKLIPKDDPKYSLVQLFSNEVLSSMAISSHNYEEALKYALQAVDILENDQDLDLTLFSSAYSLAGISYLALNDTEEAETFFQLASRWAMNPHEVLNSLTNSVSLPLYDLAASGEFNWWNYSTQTLLRPQTLASRLSSTVSGKLNKDDPLIASLIASPSTLKTLEEVADKYVAALDEAKGSSEVMTPSVCVTHVPKAKSKKPFEDDEDLHAMLKADPLFSLSYATTLANIAELKQLIQSVPTFTEEVQKNDTPSYYLSNALKILSFHSDLQNSESMVARFRGTYIPYEQGRVLRLIAANHLALGQGVTAEGLTRSALDSFQDVRSNNDFRLSYNRAMTHAFFVQVLGSWEKRIDETIEHRTQAEEGLFKLFQDYGIPSTASQMSEKTFLNMIQFPF